MGLTEEITQRKQTEEALREQEEFFRLIAENSDDFIVVLDLDGKRLYNNPSYGRLFGNVNAMKGTDCFAEIHPQDREHIKKVFLETINSGKGMNAGYRFILPDGSIRFMESRVN